MTRKLGMFTVLAIVLLPVGAQRQLSDHDRIISLTDHIEQQEKHLDSVDAVAHRTEEALTSFGAQTNKRLDILEGRQQVVYNVGEWFLALIAAPSIVGMMISWWNNRSIKSIAEKASVTSDRADTASAMASSTHELVNSHMQAFRDATKDLLTAKEDIISAMKLELATAHGKAEAIRDAEKAKT